MPVSPAESIFAAAVALSPPARDAFLTAACVQNADLRKQVERLLAAHAAAGGFLDEPAAAGHAPTVEPDPADRPDTDRTADFHSRDAAGTIIAGRYKLIERIGEGGMGSVWMAQQTEPVKRAVAVKLIKPGMDSKAVLARFDAERQALAMMDHPNIARVFDGGLAEGTPYFVMELVKGVPITQFCDDRKLTPRQRLELFVPVCHAIQHAHQKGVIHRDIKPSNVLIALYDDRPVPKVIDFGVAKAAGATLTDHTLMTGFGAVVGTPEYMSPEQASLNNLDIDTRSDVYALGVLLYELMTGSTPVDKKSLGKAALLEVLRIVREVEAPRPSAKLSTVATLPNVAANRGTEPGKLAKLLRGELDWVVMKALEKDRTRRYDTANGLARDIQRYLADDLVEARPPSAGYRLRKLVRRNKGRVAAVAAVLLVLIAGVVGTTVGLIEARRQRDAAVAAQVAEAEAARQAQEQRAQAEANGLRAAAAERQAREEAAAARAVRDFLQQDLLGQASLVKQAEAARLTGNDFEAKPNPTVHELLDRAVTGLAPDKIGAKFPDLPFVQAEALKAVGDAYSGIAQDEKAVSLLTRAVELYRSSRGPDDPATLAARHSLGLALAYTDKRVEGIAQLEAVRSDRARVLGPYHPDTFETREELGGFRYLITRKAADGLDYFTQLRDEARAHLGPQHIRSLIASAYRASALKESGRAVEAVREMEALRAEFDQSGRKVRGDHPYVLAAKQMHAEACLAAGQFDQAMEIIDEMTADSAARRFVHPLVAAGWAYLAAGQSIKSIAAFERVRQLMPADAPAGFRVQVLSGLGHAYRHAGRNAEEVPVRESIREFQLARLPADHPEVLEALKELAAAYAGAGRKPEAVPVLEDVIRRLQATRGPTHPQTLDAMMRLCYTLDGTARAAELAAEVVAARRKIVGQYDKTLANELATLGSNLVATGRPMEAEVVLREALDIRTKLEPKSWLAASCKGFLGSALLAQKKYDEAEVVLLAGYREMIERKHLMPSYHAGHPIRAIRSIARLYTEIGKPEEAAKWRAKLSKDRTEVAPPPRAAK